MQTYRIDNYGQKSDFSSFLPGIAGVNGKPIWCYYVNRGQAVVSFGVDNKDHAIMEFYPAHVAYQNVKRTGFRTFLKVNGVVTEPFSDERVSHHMDIGMNTLSISEENDKTGINTSVSYFILPQENIGALVRKVEFENTADASADIEMLDGFPALIPYGIGQDSIKNMTQLSKAWMQAEDLMSRVPFFRVRASTEDSACVTMVEGGNFSLCIDDKGEMLRPVVDMDAIFAYDNSLARPIVFEEKSVEEILTGKQNTSNIFPGSFFGSAFTLAAGEKKCFFQMIGQVEHHEKLDAYLNSHELTPDYFAVKLEAAKALTKELTDCIDTHTGSDEFDSYTRYTYMDNVLRGGLPVRVGTNKVFYVYSRKHGDLEREYNYFSMSPEYYSQGNGNFRDVNQNRREDNFFTPFVATKNIHTFYNLIQMDGYNPLSVERKTYHFQDDVKAKALSIAPALSYMFEKSFTPGQLLEALEDAGLGDSFGDLMDLSTEDVNASFGEGYWSDHWTYNLDLIEEYLRLFPEAEEEMLTEKTYSYFPCKVKVNPRGKRYEKAKVGIRQYHALDETMPAVSPDRAVSLLEKLILLCTVKFAALDPYFMGVEMEGGKPGWYDALNGLPGLLGSSMAESYELMRTFDYTLKVLRKYDVKTDLFAELSDLLDRLSALMTDKKDQLLATDICQHTDVWNLMNDIKEDYRSKVYAGISGSENSLSSAELLDKLSVLADVLRAGIGRAVSEGNGVCPTYFAYDVKEYVENEKGIIPTSIEQVQVPKFLEGPVRYLKLDIPVEEKKALYKNVRSGNLYDGVLKMYKINESLEKASFELGRCTSFTPGWLENESIWLHMEYKYFLELLRSGLYEEFAEDFKNAAVPFLDPDVYGRSILENSSFIASSVNPNESVRGKGFVSRLSGSTAEFLSIWKRMMFGNDPFGAADGELKLAFTPLIPDYLIGDDLKVSARFMGKCMVTYHLDSKKTYIPGSYKISKVSGIYEDGAEISEKTTLSGEEVKLLRDGKVKTLDIWLNN
ncbi:hypothetical protein [Butyrivibrio sp. MC2013]|uniref:hypothetical protein n=1 Tax=Butyrivibrio sp. MC2013 TaxID=1280686 RepID=UPI0003F645B7|nr:hypothetical protein [Butyrivibrio sp. MC2013]